MTALASKTRSLRRWRFALLSLVVLLNACSPRYNWRENHGESLPFSVLLPAKPTTFTRRIDLDGIAVDMTMTAAEVDGVSFAVGTAKLDHAAQTPQALAAMRTALLHNIAGVTQPTAIPGRNNATTSSLDLVADGTANGRPVRLMARLLTQDQRLYQVLMIGPPGNFAADRADMFFGSFKPG